MTRPSLAAFVKEHWSILALIATGLVTWGITTADIAQLKTDRDEAKKDHDLLVELRTEQRGIRQDVSEIKQSVKELTQQGQQRRDGRKRVYEEDP